MSFFFFFQAEDGIRDRSPSRGLGDVYKRQLYLVEKQRENQDVVGTKNPKISAFFPICKQQKNDYTWKYGIDWNLVFL